MLDEMGTHLFCVNGTRWGAEKMKRCDVYVESANDSATKLGWRDLLKCVGHETKRFTVLVCDARSLFVQMDEDADGLATALLNKYRIRTRSVYNGNVLGNCKPKNHQASAPAPALAPCCPSS
eukprot:TRINITY_DN9808_c0_g1_i2.p1 TRINITY_DN9808_c0_g1~~TRINITY_DN9808_c0_g1_i2.p1  ORF type:complete len:122 (-),score=2.84 TRINITY_DN9808_c0_g1_i2:128-493(-)